jgi:hypothetical protein
MERKLLLTVPQSANHKRGLLSCVGPGGLQPVEGASLMADKWFQFQYVPGTVERI